MNERTRGFTLIEILVTIAILATLSTVTVLVVQPAELFKQARDSRRIADIKGLMSVLKFATLSGNVLGNNNQISLSIPDSSATCAGLTGLPTLSGSWTYRCSSAATHRMINGTGWIPADFGDPFAFRDPDDYSPYLAAVDPVYDTTGAVITVLPVDPINSTTNGNYFMYLHNAGNYEFVTKMESQKYLPLMASDGGVDDTRYEAGISMALWQEAAGL